MKKMWLFLKICSLALCFHQANGHSENLEVESNAIPLTEIEHSYQNSKDKRVAKNDNYVPFFADVTIMDYPASVHKNYAVFKEKCAKCHSLILSLNSDQVLPSYWKKTIHDMQHLPGANISDDQASKVYDFLIYDSALRRKKQMDKALSNLPPEKKKSKR